jgi:ADP-ribose pyrophosphatase
MEEKTIESRQIYEGKIVNLRVDKVSSLNGKIKIREIVRHPGAAAIVPLMNDEDGDERKVDVLLVEQYRKAVGKRLLEIPAGLLEEGESPEECARRELIEETGFQALQLDKLIQFYPSPGFSTEIIHIFKATSLDKMGEGESDLQVKFVSLSELLMKIRKGEIKDGKTVIGVLMVANERK